MIRNKHSYLMIGLVAVGAVLFLSGSAGSGLVFLLWPLACLAMMFVMMRSMGGMGHGGGMGGKVDQHGRTGPVPVDGPKASKL